MPLPTPRLAPVTRQTFPSSDFISAEHAIYRGLVKPEPGSCNLFHLRIPLSHSIFRGGFVPQAGNFACETCGKEYRWKPELAGKRVKCKCGGVMTVPEQEPPDSEHDIYGISDPETDPAPKRATVAPRRAAATAVAEEGNEYRCPYRQQNLEPG